MAVHPYIALCHSAAAMEPTCRSATLQVATLDLGECEDWKATVSVSKNASTRGRAVRRGNQSLHFKEWKAHDARRCQM